MRTIIISLDMLMTCMSFHILIAESFGDTITLLTGTINSPKKLQVIKEFIEKDKKYRLAQWFKQEFNLQHQKITISYGPEVRKWLKNLK